MSIEFINLGPDEIDAGIQHALEAIGQFADVDRSYVFLLSGDGTTMDNTHVSNILSKLHLASRTQAALYALREGLASLEDIPSVGEE